MDCINYKLIDKPSTLRDRDEKSSSLGELNIDHELVGIKRINLRTHQPSGTLRHHLWGGKHQTYHQFWETKMRNH